MVQNYTLTYHRVCGIDINLDVYLPEPPTVDGGAPTEIQQELPIIPSVVFFHGGGLTSGSREIYPETFKGTLLILEPLCTAYRLWKVLPRQGVGVSVMYRGIVLLDMNPA